MLGALVGTLERARPSRILALLIVVQWLSVLGLALTVRHAGWIYYQGGDQLWYYTTAWLLAHGHLGITPIGYLWPVLLAPISLAAGPNLAHAYAAITIIDVLVLLPVATVALYGIAHRIAGRLFGYWTTAVWIALPFFGILYANPGYHQRYTELFLPQALGLTAMADFPTTVAALVSAYFTARAVLDEHPRASDALAAGLAAGAAIGIKPSMALFLGGPALALLGVRRLRGALYFGIALLPALATLTVWKWRGLGNLPILAHGDSVRLAVGSLDPTLALDLHKYINLDFGHLAEQLRAMEQYFWSGRLIEVAVPIGLIALARRSLGGMLLIGGWFASFVLVKGTYGLANFTDGSILRFLMPAAPAFVLLVAALALLLPGAKNLVRAPATTVAGTSTRQLILLFAAALGTAVVPFAVIAAIPTDKRLPPRVAAFPAPDSPPIPAETNIGLQALVGPQGTVTLTWSNQAASGAPVFYQVFRGPSDQPDYKCTSPLDIEQCIVNLREVGETAGRRYVDKPGSGTWTYQIGVAANWLDSPLYGDVYLMSWSVTVPVPAA